MYSIEQSDKQLLNSSARIRYHLYFEHAQRHVVRIVMEIDVAESGNLVLGLPVWIPGSYKIRDYISTLGSFSLTNHAGKTLAWQWLSKNRLEVAAEQGVLRVEYMYYAYEKDSTIRSSHVTRSHAFLNLVTCCLFAEGREQEVHHVHFYHDRSHWKHISTALSPVREETPMGEAVVLGALNYDILVDSPVEIGNHFVTSFEHQGSVVETAIAYRGNFNPQWLSERIKTIVETEANIFGGLPFDRYVFIIHLFPGMRGGGLEHARSSVNAMDTWNDTTKLHRLLSLLVHEFLHVWNVKRIRPRELGPFDYNRENYTRMLWLVEGATSYYDDHITYRCGFYTRADYLRILSKDHLTPFFRTPGRNEATIKDNSFQAWVKLYLPHDDSPNRNVSYYLHGGLIFLCLDLWIIAESGGKKRFDDGFRALWGLYKQRPALGITEDEFIEAVEGATGVAIREHLLNWLNSKGDDLPLNALFARCGLQWKETEAAEPAKIGEETPTMPTLAKLFTGLTLKTDAGRLLVAQVEDYSPAYEAGIGADDEIIFVNTTRCTSVDEFDALLAKRGENNASELVISSDTGMITLWLTPKTLTDFALTAHEEASEEEKTLLEFWLAR